MTGIPDKFMFRVGEAAKLLSVHNTTIKRWIQEGKLQAIKLPGGHYRIPRGEILRILQAKGGDK